MGMLNLWREAQGRVLRNRCDRLMQQIERIDDRTWAACSDYIPIAAFDPLNKLLFRRFQRGEKLHLAA